MLLDVAQKGQILNFYDAIIRRELESEQLAMIDVEADYIASIDGKNLDCDGWSPTPRSHIGWGCRGNNFQLADSQEI